MSFKKHVALSLVVCAANLAAADTIQLKDSAAVTGKILAEKPDSVVVDVGYTVLVVPGNAISGISGSSSVLSVASPGGSLLDVTPQFYTAGMAASTGAQRPDPANNWARRWCRSARRKGWARGFSSTRTHYLINEFSRHRRRNRNFRGSLQPGKWPA